MKPRDWLDNFFKIRNLTKPHGNILFSYQVKKGEYRTLQAVLTENLNHASSSYYFDSWAAAFCLFVAEWYRREYNSNWSWQDVEKRIGISFPPKKHSDIVTTGLQGFWKRPIRDRGDSGRDLLGSLFLEGGLPWTLVQSNHGFGRLVRKGLKEYYRSEYGHSSITDIVSEDKHYLPHAFQNIDTIHLIIGIIERLMNLVKNHPLKEQANPYEYLDDVEPTWRSEFPIPLDEKNAQDLVNQWLFDANKHHQKIKNFDHRDFPIQCTHYHIGKLSSLKIKTKIQYPRIYTIKASKLNITTTRFELILFEGEKALCHEGIVYGSKKDSGIELRFQKAQSEVLRNHPQSPLNLRIMENGNQIDKITLVDSIIDPYFPIVFDCMDDQYKFISNSSCSLKSSKALIRIPRGTKIDTVNALRKGIGPKFTLWLEICENTKISFEDEQYTIRLNSETSVNQLSLHGYEYQLDSLPSITYHGIPKLKLHNQLVNNTYSVYLNGINSKDLIDSDIVGVVNYSVQDEEGFNIYRRKIGILPKGFQAFLKPAYHGDPAQIKIKNIDNCSIEIDSKELNVREFASNTGVVYELFPYQPENPPTTFLVRIRSHNNKSVILKFPYPRVGATLLDANENMITPTILSIDNLLGLRLILSSGLDQEQHFDLVMELILKKNNFHPTIEYRYTTVNTPITINLFSLRTDILQLLSTVIDQDAYIRITVTVGADQRLLDLSIRRYEADITWNDDELNIYEMSTQRIINDAHPIAMKLNDPGNPGIVLHERESEGVGTGIYSISTQMEKDGPWLIIPSAESTLHFRPRLFLTGEYDHTTTTKVKSLYKAVQSFHPEYNCNIIDHHVNLMSEDLFHSSWNYLNDLKNNFSHIPLSSFETWLSLAKNKNALATAVFRIDMNEAFCSRISDELAILWESIPVEIWRTAYHSFNAWFLSKGLPKSAVDQIVKQKVQVMNSTVSILGFLEEYISIGFIQSINKQAVEGAFKIWYQELMIEHSYDRWPVMLERELVSWMDENNTNYFEKKIPTTNYSKTITFLPLFIARVTVGDAKLTDLGLPIDQIKFLIKRISDFDKKWFTSVHSMMVYYLLQEQTNKKEI